MKKYSHIVCIGDSFTNETQHYKNVELDKIFKKINYEFKSYPQILSELYECEYITLGAPGRQMTFTIQDLINNINYILTLENPLVLFQFGYFMNATIKLSDNLDFIWKELIDTGINTTKDLDNKNEFITVNKNSELINSMSSFDKLSIVNWFEKYEEFRNYYFIEYFISICNHIKELKDIDIFGFFFTKTKFKIPNNKYLVHLFDKGGFGLDGIGGNEKTGIDLILKDFGINDGHKSTEGNLILAEEIKKRVDEKVKNNLDI